MMKCILTLALALAALMLLALLPAQAEVSLPEEVYRIVLRTAEGDMTLGTGVLFGTDTTLLTAAACWDEGEVVAIGADGVHAVSYRGAIIGTHLITLGLATPSAATPLTVTTADYLLDYKIYGVNAQGEAVAMDVRGSRIMVLDDRAEALIYAQEGLLPGAILYGDDFGLACVILWQETEGEGAYASVADVTLTSLFGAGDDARQTRLVHGFTAEYRDGHIIVDLSGVTGYMPTEDTVLTVYASITTNPYLTRDNPPEGEATVMLPAVPGTEMMIWVSASTGEPEETPYPETAEDVVFVETPEAEPFTLNGLKNLRMSVTTGNPGKDGVTTDFLPQQPLTREAIIDPDLAIYFQTEDTYACDAEDDDHTLMVILYTPEGYSYYYYSGYVFMPEYAKSDLWLSNITSVFEDYERFCDGEPWPAGEYTVLYTIDGGEVARFTFTLE